MNTPIGDRLREWRTEAGLTLAEAGKRIDTPHSMWSELEHGTRTPSMELAIRIERVVGVKLEEWRTKDGKEPLFSADRIESVRRFGLERAVGDSDRPVSDSKPAA